MEVLWKRDRHRASTKLRLGVIRWVHEIRTTSTLDVTVVQPWLGLMDSGSCFASTPDVVLVPPWRVLGRGWRRKSCGMKCLGVWMRTQSSPRVFWNSYLRNFPITISTALAACRGNESIFASETAESQRVSFHRILFELAFVKIALQSEQEQKHSLHEILKAFFEILYSSVLFILICCR
jgi:hypothetical protein